MVYLILSYIFIGCGDSENPVEEPPVEVVEEKPVEVVEEKAKEPTVIEIIDQKQNVTEAFNYAKSFMDETQNKSSLGTELFAFWANKNLKWSSLKIPKDETSFGMVKKSPDPERGKRMCWNGTIVQIQKSEYRGFIGILMTRKSDIIHFYAVGSTGALVEQSSGRFCGFVTGLFSYNNSGGGTSHGLDMVGMFKLPANTDQ